MKSGTTIPHTYSQGGYGTGPCALPSRTMLTTGRYIWHAKERDMHLDDERAAGRLWPQSLKSAGYETYMTGNRHVCIGATTIFDHTARLRGDMPKDNYDTTKSGLQSAGGMPGG